MKSQSTELQLVAQEITWWLAKTESVQRPSWRMVSFTVDTVGETPQNTVDIPECQIQLDAAFSSGGAHMIVRAEITLSRVSDYTWDQAVGFARIAFGLTAPFGPAQNLVVRSGVVEFRS